MSAFGQMMDELEQKNTALELERDEARRALDLAREDSTRDLEAKRAAEDERDRLRAALEAVEWIDDLALRAPHECCPQCYAKHKDGHQPYCQIGKSLGRPECAK